MSFHATALRQSFCAAILLGFLPLSASAQVPNSPIVFDSRDGVTSTLIAAPSIGGSDQTASSSDENQWLQVEVHYSVSPVNGDWLDAVVFKVWIEGRDLLAPDAPTKDGIAVGLIGSVTYLNLEKNKDAYGVFYVHPSVLKRYSTARGVSDFDHTFNVHVEAYVGGNKVDYFDKNKEKDPAWYTQLRTVSGLVYRQDQGPFFAYNVGRYPMMKLPKSPDDDQNSPAAVNTPPATPPAPAPAQ